MAMNRNSTSVIAYVCIQSRRSRPVELVFDCKSCVFERTLLDLCESIHKNTQHTQITSSVVLKTTIISIDRG